MSRNSRGPLGVFALMAGVIIGSTLLTYLFGSTVMRAHAVAAERRRVIENAELVLSTVKDAETGQRGFLLTGDDSYLAPYHEAVRRLPDQLGALANARAIGVEDADLQSVKQLAATKLEELAQTIELRRRNGAEAATAVVQSGAGKQTMDQLRAVLARFSTKQNELLRVESQEADRSTRWRTAIFVGTGLLNLLFLSWAYRRISAELRAREAARHEADLQRHEAQKQKDYFAVTLASIGDSVIVTDADARITFMNPMAEQITGWPLAEARGRSAREVFQIINEDTREPVTSPVEKVIQSGVIVGLANHTLLIRRDGTELPIDDSGAPIRDDSGKLYGVVLVFRDFSEHQRRQRELREAKDAAETANRAKDKFLAMLSHELRTPLAPVLMTLNLWESSDDLPTALRSDVQMMRRNVELEARIIDDLLDLTRIARGLLSFTPADTDVHELIQHLATLSESEISGKGLQLQLDLAATRHHVHTDSSRLQQVLWNVVRNAVKFTDTGRISIATANDAAANLVVTITDTGRGISPVMLGKLFVPFEQADRDYRNAGLGLGLAISRALVDLLGGSIEGKSEGLGRGSEFKIVFPTADAATKEEGAVASAPERRSLRILIVEDHDDTAQALARLLRKRGYEVERADSVASGIAAANRGTFDLLLCDIGLPDGTGFDLIEEVRRTSKTPALALSGFGTVEDVQKSKNAGFGAHLTKPVNFQKLEAAIIELIAARQDGA